MAAVARLVLPDADMLVRRWARDLVSLGRANGQVMFGMPRAPHFPLIVLTRVAGMPDLDVDVDYPLYQWDVWSQSGKREADKIAHALVHELRTLGPTPVQAGDHDVDGGSGVLLGASAVTGPRPMPDPDASLYRNVVQAQITLRPSGP